jgi:HlyD family secretion protein
VHANYDVAKAQVVSAQDQADMAKASLDSAEDQLSKTTIVSPLTGTVTKLNSELGERVLGTVQNMGTEIMTVSDLNEMEARVDVGETDVVLISPGENVHLEVDAFKDGKFSGVVTEVANSSGAAGAAAAAMNNNNSQEATKFSVKIRIKEKEAFRPGMSCTAEVETRSRTNVLCVPIASVTTRLPGGKGKGGSTNSVGTASNSNSSNTVAATPNPTNSSSTNKWLRSEKKARENQGPKQVEVVFLHEGDHVKMVPVKHGIGDDMYYEITEGVKEGQEVISGGYRAISRDLEDGKKVKIGPAAGDVKKDDEGKQ